MVNSSSCYCLYFLRYLVEPSANSYCKGARDAATQYFRGRIIEKLSTAFLPVIKSSLDKFEAIKHYADLINTYNNFPTTINKINPDLPSYVAERAVTALFDQIEKEEVAIRNNPLARTTDILKKVFGWANRN